MHKWQKSDQMTIKIQLSITVMWLNAPFRSLYCIGKTSKART